MREEKDKEDWRRLSELASVEKDPERLRSLVEQIIDLIDSRQKPAASIVPKSDPPDNDALS